MRTRFAVLAAVLGLVSVDAATAGTPPPQPDVKTYDVADLIGPDAMFRTVDELVAVVKSLAKPSEFHIPNRLESVTEADKPNTLTVCGFGPAQEAVDKVLDTFREIKRRRGLSVVVESVVVSAQPGFGELALLPKEGDGPAMLTEKEFALTMQLVRLEKADDKVDVLARPTMAVGNGTWGTFSTGERPEVTRGETRAIIAGEGLIGYRQTVKALVKESGKPVELKFLTTNSTFTDGKSKAVTVLHCGAFAADVPVGGTVVARVPMTKPPVPDNPRDPLLTPASFPDVRKGAAGKELYVFLTVKEVKAVGTEKPAATDVSPMPAKQLPAIQLPPLPSAQPTAPQPTTTGGFQWSWEVVPVPLVAPSPAKPATLELRMTTTPGTSFSPAEQLTPPTLPAIKK